MPSGNQREIVRHGNTGEDFQVFGPFRRLYRNVSGSSAANQIAQHLNDGAVERRPGFPNAVDPLSGNNATHYLEGLQHLNP